MSETGEAVYRRTYSRKLPDGSNETWDQTVQRVVDGNLALVDERYQLPGEREDLIRLMTEFKIIPAGRHLWASGVKGAQHLMNCWVSHWTKKPSDHFEFTFMRLMEGGGVGTNYSNFYLSDYPAVQQQNLSVEIVCDSDHPDYQQMLDQGLISQEYDSDWDGAFLVEDSREGWAAALVDLIDTFYRTDSPHRHRVYDVSNVRAGGARLKTFGGTASGPDPFARMMIDVCEILNRVGDWGDPATEPNKSIFLSGIDAVEIDHAIAQCVVSGGVRRSARMAMMSWDDPQIEQFLRIKQDTGSHWTTNISVVVDDEFWSNVAGAYDSLGSRVLDEIAEGMHSNGEPGFFDISLANEHEPDEVVCTNPCLTGDTVIATVGGPRTFADLAEDGRDVAVYSWDPKTKTPVIRWMRRPHKTRENTEILKVTFDSGLVVRCTPDHSFYTFRGRKVKAHSLKPGKSIRAFSASRDGSGHERVHGWDSNRNGANHQWTHRMIWENEHGPIEEGMVIAHLDGDPSNNSLENLAMMTPYEHASYDYPKRLANGFHHPNMERHPANHKVISVEAAGYADVYNGMVEDSHTYIVLDPDPIAGHMSGIVSANCGEITLNAWEPCNLGHVNLAAFAEDESELVLAHRLMTRFLIRATFAQVSDPKSRAVLDRNRRIGVGHLGVASYLAMRAVSYSDGPENDWFVQTLRGLAYEVNDAAGEFCNDLRIPIPVKLRTVAPTGTIAKMPGVSEGIHPIFSKYFIRRIRFSTVDEDQRAQLDDYRARGFDVEPCQYAANTEVVSIPTKDTLVADVAEVFGESAADQIVQGADELTLDEMLRFQAMYQHVWADNAVSYTANFDPAEYTVEEIKTLLVRYGGKLKGATVFPEISMPQSPYQRLTREQFELYELVDVADGVDEECASGACPIR